MGNNFAFTRHYLVFMEAVGEDEGDEEQDDSQSDEDEREMRD